MDTTNSPEPVVPNRLPTRQSAAPVLGFGVRPAASPQFSAQTVLRAVARHKWWILALWMVGMAALAVPISTVVKPQYEATSLLRVEPASRDLFGIGLYTGENFTPFLQTQVQLITSANVLLAAAADPRVASLPRIRMAADAEFELRRLLQVEIVSGSYLVKVSLRSPSVAEAAAIVNAVVDAYLKTTAEWTDGMTRTRIKNLEAYQRELQAQADEKQEAWLALAEKGNLDLPPAPQGHQPAGGPPQPSRTSITLEEYKRARDELFKVSVDLIEAEALLNMRRNETADPDSGRRLRRQVEDAFRADPEVIAVVEQIEKVREQLDHVNRLIRRAGDPAKVAIDRKLEILTARYQKLWELKKEILLARLEAEGADNPNRAVGEAAARVKSLRASKASYEEILSRIEISNKQESSDAVRAALIREALTNLQDLRMAVTKRLEQLRFEAKEEARICRVTEARLAGRPVSDKRPALLAATSAGMLFAVLGLFIVLEVKAERVADPDQLSVRVRTEVFVLPQLPGPQAGRDDRLEDFTQALDHLRVALCGEAVARGSRCVLITSAIGGEGKTTLAAHLASRCANAGMSVLLIDADLRRAVLGRLLDVPESPGLSDVLRGDVAAEAALVAVQADRLHLLPAGTPEHDPVQVLQGQRLGQLLAQFRQSFDLIFIDSPPVLPVPDALVVGRWVDGVVLAARYDSSRFPLVERASQRLAAAKVPVLGAVVNGVRAVGSYYESSYGYTGRTTRPSEPSST